MHCVVILDLYFKSIKTSAKRSSENSVMLLSSAANFFC